VTVQGLGQSEVWPVYEIRPQRSGASTRSQSPHSSAAPPLTASIPTPTPSPATSLHPTSPTPPPDIPAHIDEELLRARQAEIRRKSEGLVEELAELEARTRELEDKRNSQATRLFELQMRTQELEKQEQDAQEDVRKKRDALAAVREMERKVEQEAKKRCG
jgi:hypothetical protein